MTVTATRKRRVTTEAGHDAEATVHFLNHTCHLRDTKTSASNCEMSKAFIEILTSPPTVQ